MEKLFVSKIPNKLDHVFPISVVSLLPVPIVNRYIPVTMMPTPTITNSAICTIKYKIHTSLEYLE